jgi:hypothetical protein
MKSSLVFVAIAACSILSIASSSRADFNVEENKAAFYAAHPTGLVIEDFESATVNPNSTQSFAGPLNASTNNGVFYTGSILSGIELRTLERTSFVEFDMSPFAALGAGLAGLPSKAVAVNDTRLATDKISVVFDDPQTVFALELKSVDLFSNTFKTASLSIDCFGDPAREDSRIAGAQVTAVSPEGAFLGVTTDRPIRKIIIHAGTSFTTPVVDNIAFAGVPEPTSVELALPVVITFAAALRRPRKLARAVGAKFERKTSMTIVLQTRYE